MKPKKIKSVKNNLSKVRKVKIKKYPFLLIFRAVKCGIPLKGKAEKKLIRIQKNIFKLEKEMIDLFENEKS